MLDIPAALAGLLTAILMDLIVENFIFRHTAVVTVGRWGMQS